MKFKSLDDAKSEYLIGNNMSQIAADKYDYKESDRIILEKINPAFRYLEKNQELKLLCEFLNEDYNLNIRQSTAVALLPYYEEISLPVLQSIATMDDSLNAFKAKMVIKQWLGENLK